MARTKQSASKKGSKKGSQKAKASPKAKAASNKSKDGGSKKGERKARRTTVDTRIYRAQMKQDAFLNSRNGPMKAYMRAYLQKIAPGGRHGGKGKKAGTEKRGATLEDKAFQTLREAAELFVLRRLMIANRILALSGTVVRGMTGNIAGQNNNARVTVQPRHIQVAREFALAS